MSLKVGPRRADPSGVTHAGFRKLSRSVTGLPMMSDMDPRVAIVGDSVSARYGGEAVLPLHYFRRLAARGIDAYLICHVRTRAELTELLGPLIDRVRFVDETRFDVAVWQIGKRVPRQFRSILRAFGAFGAQRRGREIARELIRTKGVNLVHQPAPVSPKQPTLVGGLGVPVIIGPMNGGMVFPPAFRGMESVAERVAVRGARLAAGVMNRIASGKRHAAALLVANRRTADALPPGVGGVPVIQLVENGVDLKLFDRVDRPIDASRPTRFLFVGRLESWKGVELLLRAWPQVIAATSATLSIVGDGVDGLRLRGIAKELKLGPEVDFAGFVLQPEVAARMRDADVFVLPSLFECGGAVVLEAMARSMPVIALRWGGPADYLDPATGILIDAGTREEIVRDLARAMIELARDPERRATMGAAGRAKAEREYDWERKVDRMLEIYDAALRGDAKKLVNV